MTTLLFYWRILPPVVRGMAWLLSATLGVGRRGRAGRPPPTSFRHGGSTFVHPAYSSQLTRSELFLVMDRRMRASPAPVRCFMPPCWHPDSGCRGAFRHCLGSWRARSDPGQPDHGAGTRITAPAARLMIPGRSCRSDMHAASTMDAIVKGTVAGLNSLLNLSRC